MSGKSRLTALLLCVFGVFALANAEVQAQSYPSKPVHLVVPYAAGGPTDLIARAVAQKLEEKLGQPVVVENKPGGGTLIAHQYVSRAEPDGYTLIFAVVAGMVTGPMLQSAPPYDPVSDFTPISVVSVNPLILVASPSSGIDSLSKVIELAKAKPGKVMTASYGSGTPTHLAIECLNPTAKIELTHVPYKGSAPALIDVYGGRVPLMFDVLVSAAANIRAGKLKAIALAQRTRSPLAPDVPTFVEAGLPDFEAITWVGIAAPAKTPKEIVSKLNDALHQILADPALKDRLAGLGGELRWTSAKDFSDLIRSDNVKWKRVITDAGIKSQ